MSRVLRLISVLLLAMLLPVAATGCGPSEAELAKYKTQGDRYLVQGLDPDGYSKADIDRMSDRERYELFKKRYERMHEVAGDVMTAATGPDQEWEVSAFGFVSSAGGRGQTSLPRGAKSKDTYTFDINLFHRTEQPLDYKAAVENMQEWMVEQGYNTSTIGEFPGPPVALRVDGLTDDGFLIWFKASESSMRINIFGGAYWGDSDELNRTLSSFPRGLLDEYRFILPYEFLPFPPYRED